MAGDGGRGRQHCRHASSFPGKLPMPDDIDAAVDSKEPPDPVGLRRRASRVAEGVQLPRRQDPALPRRQLGQLPVPNPLSFVAHRATKDRDPLGSPRLRHLTKPGRWAITADPPARYGVVPRSEGDDSPFASPDQKPSYQPLAPKDLETRFWVRSVEIGG